MDKIERVKTVLNHEVPDRVPTISCMDVQKYIYDSLGEVPVNSYRFITNPITAKIIDITAPLLNQMGVFERDVREFMLKKLESDVKMGFDATWALYANIFLFKDSKEMTDIFGGRLYKIVDDGHGNMDVPMYIRGTFETPDDWRRFNKKRWEAMPEKMFKFNELINREFGKDIYLFGSNLFGIFENMWQPFGFEKFVRILKRDRAFIEEAVEYNKIIYFQCVDASVDAGLKGIVYTDDMAYKSGPMLNPKMMEELFGDAFREITKRAHDKGVKMIIHTDGNTIPLLKYFVDWGFDGQHALEPTANVDLADVRKEIGEKLTLCGHLDIAHALSHGTKEDVFENVRDSIKKGGKKGNIMLGPCNSHSDIKLQNIRWMLEAVNEYGNYPLSIH